MEQVWNAVASEGSVPDRLTKTLSLIMRRTQYDRLPPESGSELGTEIVESPGRRVRETDEFDIEAHTISEEARPEEPVPPSPSLWGRVRDAYMNLMWEAAEDASTTSVVPVAKTVERSLTVGSGFGKKVEAVPAENSLPFKLTKAEQKYLEHLRKRYDGRYA